MKGNLLSHVIAYRSSNIVCNPGSAFKKRKSWQRFCRQQIQFMVSASSARYENFIQFMSDLLRETQSMMGQTLMFLLTLINYRSAPRLPFHKTSSKTPHNPGERGTAPCMHSK